jgi:hypothetical protein
MKINAQHFRWALIGLVVLNGGCLHNDDDDDESTGVFLDSPVVGISYRTQSIAGVTDAAGEFRFVPGETVTFSVGSINLPPVAAAEEVTPADIAGVAETEAAVTGSQTATNILRFLQTLDEDSNPDNGIVIDPDAISDAQGETLNFSAPTATFEDDFEDIFGTTLIPVDQAVAHFLRQVIPLAGDWRASILALSFNSSSLNPFEDSYWEKIDLDIELSGAFQADSEESSGDTSSDSGQFNLALLDETGQLGLNGAPEWFGAIDAGKTVFGFVDIDDDIGPTEGCCGGQQLGVAVRRSEIIGYELSDIAGTWRGFSMTIEDDPDTQHVARATYTVASNGAYTASETTSYRNQPDDVESGMTGMFSHNGNGEFAWSETGSGDDDNGVMDAGKSVIAGVFSGAGGSNGDEEIAVLIKQGNGYETSDLRGIWRSFLLTVAEDGSESYQDRGEICIQNNGAYKAKFVESGGDTGTDAGTFTLNPTTGVLSVQGSTTFNGALDAGKTVAGFVDFDDDVNGLQIGVLVKTNFLPVTFTCP